MTYRVPARIEFEADAARVRWQETDGGRFTDPFFEESLVRIRRQLGGKRTATSPLSAWSGDAAGGRSAAFIFHVSRCGSTLVSSMLAALSENLVVSEAPVFDDILRGRRDDEALADPMRERWLRHAVCAFADSQAQPPARVIVKLDCWHIFAIERIRRAFPGSPLLFVYRSPLEVLVSLMRRPSLTLVRDTVTPEEIGVTREARDAMSREDLAAAILGAFFREARRHRAHLIPVSYASLPDAVWSGLPGLPIGAADVARLRRAAASDAKEPRHRFVPDAERKRADASAQARAACARWADPHYERWRAAL
jgi:hypothetical protein